VIYQEYDSIKLPGIREAVLYAVNENTRCKHNGRRVDLEPADIEPIFAYPAGHISYRINVSYCPFHGHVINLYWWRAGARLYLYTSYREAEFGQLPREVIEKVYGRTREIFWLVCPNRVVALLRLREERIMCQLVRRGFDVERLARCRPFSEMSKTSKPWRTLFLSDGQFIRLSDGGFCALLGLQGVNDYIDFRAEWYLITQGGMTAYVGHSHRAKLGEGVNLLLKAVGLASKDLRGLTSGEVEAAVLIDGLCEL
jgi:hypothetical protein